MHSVKQLILIGNKPIEGDYGFIDAEYDKVFRINKMCNWGQTGRRVDALYLGAFPHFTLVNGGKHREHLRDAGQVYMLPIVHKMFWEWRDYLTPQQYYGAEMVNFQEPRDYFGTATTSTIDVLWLLVNERIAAYKGYEITLAGVDVEGRAELLRTGEPWRDNEHSKAGATEERWLKELISTGRIKYLDLK